MNCHGCKWLDEYGRAGAGYCMGYIDMMTDDPLEECISCQDHVSKAQEDMDRFYGRE